MWGGGEKEASNGEVKVEGGMRGAVVANLRSTREAREARGGGGRRVGSLEFL